MCLKNQSFPLNVKHPTSQDALKHQIFRLNFNDFTSQLLCLNFKDLTSQGVLKIQTFYPNLKYSIAVSLGALKSQTLSELA